MKISKENRLVIIKLIEDGISQYKIAESFNVSQSCIEKILRVYKKKKNENT